MDIGVIYKFKNKINNKEYIGQTWNFDRRIKEHFRGYGYARLLTASIKKYGKDNFDVKIIFKTSNQELLNNVEILSIRLCNTLSPKGYNLAEGGLGGKLSQESKDKIGKFNKNKIVSQETKNKMSQSAKGKILSQETKDKISKYAKDKENKLYVYNCITHEKIIEFKNHFEMTKEINVSYHRIYDSINNHAYIKYNDLYCYVRNIEIPVNIEFILGRKVQINDEKGNIMIFASLTLATKELNIKRGIIDSLVRNKTKKSKYIKNNEVIRFTAKYYN